MVDVVPFRGLLYNPEKTGSLDQVIAPPYDVISPALQEELYQKNDNNVVRLILGKQTPEDTESDNRYTRSAEVFHRWRQEGILTQDERPCFYAYSQDYEFDGKHFSRIGFFARVRTEDFSAGNICPHEFTLAKAKKDRTLLITACRANFSPIFGLFSDPDGGIEQKLLAVKDQAPLGEVDDGKVVHRLWRLQDADTEAFITESFKSRKIYIADGHHRYETALAYHKEHGGEVPDSAHVMMFLTSLDSDSMSIFPIHRLVKTPTAFDRESFLNQMKEYFEVTAIAESDPPEKIRSAVEQSGRERISFAVYLGKGDCHLLQLKDSKNILPLLEADEPKDLQVLDVAQLHFIVLRHILKVDTRKPEAQQHMSYKVDVNEAVRMVDDGEYQLAFFMNPTGIDQVRKLAENGIRLPQKATFFYPKLLSGLVINAFENR